MSTLRQKLGGLGIYLLVAGIVGYFFHDHAAYWGLLASSAFAATIFIGGLINGEDGRLSSSKFQFYLWTAAFSFTYVAFSDLHMFHGANLSADVPRWTLLAMGLSATTLLAAKGITVGYIQEKKLLQEAGAANKSRSQSYGIWFAMMMGVCN